MSPITGCAQRQRSKHNVCRQRSARHLDYSGTWSWSPEPDWPGNGRGNDLRAKRKPPAFGRGGAFFLSLTRGGQICRPLAIQRLIPRDVSIGCEGRAELFVATEVTGGDTRLRGVRSLRRAGLARPLERGTSYAPLLGKNSIIIADRSFQSSLACGTRSLSAMGYLCRTRHATVPAPSRVASPPTQRRLLACQDDACRDSCAKVPRAGA